MLHTGYVDDLDVVAIYVEVPENRIATDENYMPCFMFRMKYTTDFTLSAYIFSQV